MCNDLVRHVAHVFACATLCSFAAAAQQSSYPARPVRIIVGFTPASSNDILARFVALKLTDRLGQQIVVDNRPGANGIIGVRYDANEIAPGVTEVLAYGTAVNLEYQRR